MSRSVSLSLATYALMPLAGLTMLEACSSNNAQGSNTQQLLVDQATTTVRTLFHDTTPASRQQKLLTQAKAVMICPSLFNMSIVFGGSSGQCLLLSRDARNSWSDPAFYSISGGSFGLQLGYQNTQLMLFIMSQRGLQALLDHQFTFNAHAGASFADMGSSTQDTRASGTGSDIYALQRSNGIFAGASLGGVKLSSNSESNRSYYKQIVGPEDIVINMRVNNSAADPLRRVLMNAASTPQQTSTGLNGTSK